MYPYHRIISGGPFSSVNFIYFYFAILNLSWIHRLYLKLCLSTSINLDAWQRSIHVAMILVYTIHRTRERAKSQIQSFIESECESLIWILFLFRLTGLWSHEQCLLNIHQTETEKVVLFVSTVFCVYFHFKIIFTKHWCRIHYI